MRNLFALTAIAPLALLAACGDAPVEDEDVALDPAGLGLESPDVAAADMPQPTENSVETVDYSGDYTFTGLDGSESTLTLDKEAGTYSYKGPGIESSGTYETLDGSRIAIEDFDGRAGYFSIADGALYRLADENTPYDTIEVNAMYRRNEGVPSVAPDASTNSVQDKRD